MTNAGRDIQLTKLVTIDGETYQLTMFSPMRAFKLGARVAKLIGEPIAAMASAAGDQSKVSNALPLAIKGLMQQIDQEDVWQLIQELSACVSQNNALIDVNKAFQGKLGSLFKLIVRIIEFQFADFTDAIGQVIAEHTSKIKP